MEIKNKKIIITGAANGIGKELTKQLLLKGAYVAAVDIDAKNLKIFENELHSEKLETFVVDISDKDSINLFKEHYKIKNEYVDILINNAGIVQPFVGVNELTDDVINRVMNVNFFGMLNLTRNFLNSIISRKEGYIVNISSMGGFFPFPKQSIYAASKAAVKMFTEGLYSELLDTNVKVMAVFPGAIATDILHNSNVEIKYSGKETKYKMLSASEAARQIIVGIEKNKFKLFVGSDSKFIKFLYKLNSKLAIKFVNKKFKNFN